MAKLIYGVGTNDADYNVYSYDTGSQVVCQFYARWCAMLKRCYSEKTKAKQPSYIGCKVCDEWLTFSNFRSWMQNQDWKGKDLDKDLLVVGNKTYSPDSCCFVDRKVNSFINSGTLGRGASMPGIYFNKRFNKYQACCANPITGRGESAGYYLSEIEAHLAWKKRKHEISCQLADLQTDSRVADALRSRYQ